MFNLFSNKKEIYLDYASSTPIDKGVLKKMTSISWRYFANPSSIHKQGVLSKNILEESRREVARIFSIRPEEIVFTSGGTESNVLAISGVILGSIEFLKNKGEGFKPHIITSSIEHPSIRDFLFTQRDMGTIDLSVVEVDEGGVVTPVDVINLIKPETVLVSIMYVNNEIGTIEPLKEISKLIRKYKKEKESRYPYFHSDGCQAVSYLDINLERLGVDLFSCNGSKIYGPKGSGFLFVKKDINFYSNSSISVKAQGKRAGTENLSAIVGFKEALLLNEKIKKVESARVIKIRDLFIKKLEDNFPNIIFNGSIENKINNNIHFSVKGIESDLLVLELSEKGIAVSSKSACQSHDEESSYVVSALRKKEIDNLNYGSIRISLGRETRTSDIDYFILALKKIFNKYKL